MKLLQSLRRHWIQRRPVPVTRLCGMAICEQRVVLEARLGERATDAQKAAMIAGTHEHECQHAAARYHMTAYPIWRSLGLGIVVGLPLAVAGEFLLSVASGQGFAIRLLAHIFAGPGAVFRALGGDVFGSLPNFFSYVAMQTLYYSAVAFALITLLQRRPA